MKKIIYSLLAVWLFSSCSNWFDAPPKTQDIDEKTLFCNESAFRNALTGIYTELRSNELYGSNLSLGGVEFLGQSFVPDAPLQAWTSFDYQSAFAREWAQEVWQGMYHAIYSANNLMRLLDERDDVIFVKGSREMMQAELKALRAVLHYELVRLFHPAYVADQNYKAVAWMESADATPQVWTTEVLVGHILDELEQAIQQLEKYDPILTGESYDADALFGERPQDRVWKLNYYAAVGLKARIWMTLGTKEGYAGAYRYAQKIMTSGEYKLVEIPGSDLGFSSEQLMSLSSLENGLQALSEDLFVSRGVKISSVVGLSGLQASAPNDKRLKWFSTDLGSMSPKFGKNSLVANWKVPQGIPFIKYGEVWLIAAEAALRSEADKSAGYNLLKDFIAARYSSMAITANSTVEEMLEEIGRQYRYEFVGEGQLFYFYKRLNVPVLLKWDGTEVTMGKDKYVLPVPVI